MRICVLVDRHGTRRWHTWIAQALGETGEHLVSIVETNSHHVPLLQTRLFLELERLVFRLAGEHAADRIETSTASPASRADVLANCDVLINCATGGNVADQSCRIITPVYNHVASELEIVAAFLERRSIEIGVADTANPILRRTARPAVEQRNILTLALDNILSRTAELIAASILSPIDSRKETFSATTQENLPPGVTRLTKLQAAFIARRLNAIVHTRLKVMAETAPRWAVAWRKGTSLRTMDTRRGGPFALLPDDGQRFYADPFVYYHGGHHYVFCEEFPFASAKGLISVSRLEDDGTFSPPRVVLERPYHLSYPFVFEDGGQIWMIPETADARTVELYRAVSFPDRWELAQTLIGDVRGYDATLFRQGPRIWMFLATSRWLSSSWDGLGLYCADRLQGPWKPHPSNPSLIDAHAARPAGALWHDGTNLIRPAQDCSAFYGGAIQLCRVDQLNPAGFKQVPLCRITASHAGENLGIHTINEAAGVETVDVFGPIDKIAGGEILVTATT